MTRLDIATQVETITNVTQQRSLVNFAIGIALQRIVQEFDWPYYMQQGIVNTIATYITGTAKVTLGSKTITGVGTTWTSDMVGRKFRHSNENAYYVIASFVSTTSLTLNTPYQGATDSTGSTYTIYKDEYRLAPDVDKYKKSIQIQNGVAIQDVPITTFDTIWPTPQSYTDPNLGMLVGTKLDTYSTGTVTTTVNGTTITGSGTSWDTVEGLGRMSDIRIGNDRYTIKSVDSATQVTIYEPIVTAVSGSAYVCTLNNLVMQLYPIPDAQRNINYRYFRLPEVLANDYDIPDMPHAWHRILYYGSAVEVFLQKGDINKSYDYCEAQFTKGIELMKKKIGSFSVDTIYKRRSVDRTPRFLDGLEASNFDIKYSRP